ncbi:HD domain-containing protein [Caloramator sp. mosi_1]|uniref:HD domain-containing protein n=1 Tax=Caloramator sp. mosi_1 TaxID=3023090 RepID=UPI00236247B6|nr:HD domain-containing protein [Caloramator sp. mosi_1]WDC85217.1 HD domain-containing protein [Caloramator sp. mosi_1]
MAKDKENYGCAKDETFIAHSIKTLNYALAIANLYYQENPERNTEDNLKKIVVGALFHDINKLTKYKREKETDLELRDVEAILNDLGIYSEFRECAKFILSSAIHKGRQKNTYKVVYALDDNEEEEK